MNKDDYSNFEILGRILDRIHSVRDRRILCDRYIHGLTFEQLAEAHDLSVRQTKTIVYRGSEKIFK